MSNDFETSVVADTVSEVANPEAVSRERVKQRLSDWQRRVHELYSDIEKELAPGFVIDRSGKQFSQEELVQRTGLSQDDVPRLDILRIERPAGILRALLYPRGLWIIGANGALDMRLLRPPHHQSIYRIVDMSRPMIPPSHWSISPLGDPTDEKPFSGRVVRSMLE